MSGVEAILGVISGGVGLVSLGIQLSECAVKLKRIQSVAKNAPQTISGYIFSLETMSIALQELEQHRKHNAHNGTLLGRCIIECRESTSQIQQLVNKMESYMTESNSLRGKLFTVYKDQEVRELFDRLERAKSSLELAYMIYLAAEQRQRDQAHANTLSMHSNLLSSLQSQISEGNAHISQQLTLSLQPPSVSVAAQSLVSNSSAMIEIEPKSTTEVEINTDKTSRSRDHLAQWAQPHQPRKIKPKYNKPRIRIRMPIQIYNKIWDFAITSAQSGWGLHLHTYNVVPHNSLIFRYCELGDLPAMQRLIKSGEGSLLDTMPDIIYGSEDNWTLLEVRTQYLR
jgi:hypothetical protein